MKYHLRVYDNYHHGDGSESYDHGSYASYEEAERAAKAIVVEFLEHNWERGKSAGILCAEYALNGEDPVILPADYPSGKRFSASDYASETELPYVVHLSNVAMEILVAASHTRNFNLPYAIQVALLHDTIEDTETTFEEVKVTFGEDIAMAVLALSKDDTLPKDQQIKDSLTRIKKLRKEVWAVKLADRITNLQPPPASWTDEKNLRYAEDARLILDELREGNQYLAERLEAKISEYRNLNKKYLFDGF